MESREPQGLESGFTFSLGRPDPEIFNISDKRKHGMTETWNDRMTEKIFLGRIL